MRPVRGFSALVLSALMLLPPHAASHAASVEDIPVCHGFGCRYRETVSISEAEWNQIRAFFRKPARTPAQEREQIKKASGWFEVIVGRYTPIHLDKGKNDLPKNELTQAATPKNGEPDPVKSREGQMDCIDESRNMTTYLTVMERAGLFRHHRVVERARRRSAFDQHYAGQIEELETGQRWVVDSWFYDYGSLPYVEEATEWHDIPFLFGTSFPEAVDG